MKRRTRGEVRAKGTHRIEVTIYYLGKRFRPTIDLPPTKDNIRRAKLRLQDIYARIDAGTFDLLEDFPDYRLRDRYLRLLPIPPRTCNDVIDKYLAYAEHRVAMNDMAFSTYNTYLKILNRTWRPRIGHRWFRDITHTDLLEIAMSQGWRNKRTYNNGLTAMRCAFKFGYKDHLDAKNPAEVLPGLRITKKDRRAIEPFTLAEAERIIARIHQEWGEAMGNYDEFRFFTGLRQSEQIGLRLSDYDAEKGTLFVRRAVVLGRDKDRTKTNEDRVVVLCPRAQAVLTRQLTLHAMGRATGKITHDFVFFKDNGGRMKCLNYPYRRWRYVVEQLQIRYREPYYARHSSVTWNLMIGKNILWVADQHGHSLEVMLTKYAKWQRGATEADVDEIKRAMAADATAGRVSLPPRTPALPPSTLFTVDQWNRLSWRRRTRGNRRANVRRQHRIRLRT